MENDAIVAIRMKYAEDLEEILQCPVCFERPSGSVPTCVQGHHVCHKCQPKMKYCPLCNNRFKGSRNYLAENLNVKFNDILISLLEPRHAVNKKVLDNKRCVATQTDTSEQNKKADKNAVISEDELCMCRIGFCQSQLPSSCMFFHVRDFHKANLIEATALYDGFIKHWNLEFSLSKLFDYAINIKDMGIFFFNIFINEEGILSGNVQVVYSCYIERQFHYTLIVVNNETGQSVGYDGPVQNMPVENKFPFACSFGKGLFESFFEPDMQSLKKQPKPFTCRLILARQITDAKKSLSKSHSSPNLLNNGGYNVCS